MPLLPAPPQHAVPQHAAPVGARRQLVQLVLALAAALALPFALLAALHPEPDEAVLALDQGWFGGGADAQPWRPAPDARPVTLPHDWRREPVTHAGTEGTYHFHVDLQVPPDRLWALYLPAVSMNAAVYLNGEILGHGGAMTSPLSRHRSRPMYVTVPNGLLHSGRNVLAIRVAAEPAGSGLLDLPRLGAHETLRGTYEQRHALTAMTSSAIAMLLATVALLMAVLWTARRRDTVYLWFALACAAWAVHLLDLIVVDPPVPARAWVWLGYASGAALAASAVMFVLRFLGERAPGQRPSPEVAGMLFAGLAVVVLAGHDTLQQAGVVPRTHGVLLHLAAPVVLLTFGHVLVRRFAAALDRAESANAELERRVAEREAELARHHARLRELEREQAVAAERERLMRDMHDGVGGTILAALNLSQQAGPDPQRVTVMLRQALQDLRLMIDSLDPLEGDLRALLAMFRARAQPQLQAAGVASRWSLEDLPPCAGLTPDRALQLLRIAQEAVNNVVRHAGASCLEVRLALSQDARGRPLALLQLDDDGRGFDPQQVARGRGLDNMQRRALRAGLHLRLASGPRGTTLQVTTPLD